VTVAIAPSEVALMSEGEPVSSHLIDVKVDESSKKNIQCLAKNARPRPNFKWFIGGNSISVSIG